MDFKALFDQMVAEERQKLEEATFAAKTVAERAAIERREAFSPITRIIETIKSHVDEQWKFEVKELSAQITLSVPPPNGRYLVQRRLAHQAQRFTAVLKARLDQEGFVCTVEDALHPVYVEEDERIFDNADEAAEFITRFVAKMIARLQLGDEAFK